MSSVYLHIPFCLRKCRYCDFCSFPSEGVPDAYIDALCREISATRGGTLETVYFGGGTPSLLTAGQLGRVTGTLARSFTLARDAEISMEVNPKTADAGKLAEFRSLGINRISLGMQSLDDRELAGLGRLHTAREFLSAYEDARRVGFGNVNVDLMYGIPYQSEASLQRTLSALAALAPEHISAYGLIVEPGTPFYAERDSLSLPDEDTEFSMYRAVCRTLGGAGYRHYEVSNYAKPGFACRHNLTYWEDRGYYAFGLAASSFLGGVRKTNTKSLPAYLADPFSPPSERTVMEGADAEYEYLMLRLRLADGVDEAAFSRRFGSVFSEKYAERLAPFRRAGYLVTEKGRTALTEDGLYVSSALLCDLLP